MSEVNLDRLRELAGHLRNACRQLQEFGRQDVQAFLADANTVNSAKYLLIVAAEAALDICRQSCNENAGNALAQNKSYRLVLGVHLIQQAAAVEIDVNDVAPA